MNLKYYHYCWMIISLVMLGIILQSFNKNSKPDEPACKYCELAIHNADAAKHNAEVVIQKYDNIRTRIVRDNDPYHPMKYEDSYVLQIQDDNTLLLRDGDKIVHVFNRSFEPNRNLFNVIDQDNY